jgi:hypothetical protein
LIPHELVPGVSVDYVQADPVAVYAGEMQSGLDYGSSAHCPAFMTGVVEQFGNWNRAPLTDTSPEIITVAGQSPDCRSGTSHPVFAVSA